jgi:hypothetical protein
LWIEVALQKHTARLARPVGLQAPDSEVNIVRQRIDFCDIQC